MSAASPVFYEIYRKSSVGTALMDTLDELIQSELITPTIALKLLLQFDKAATNVFATQLKTRCNAKSQLKTYRLCDEVWTFMLKNAVFKLEGENVGPIDRVKVVCCRGTALPEGKDAKEAKQEKA